MSNSFSQWIERLGLIRRLQALGIRKDVVFSLALLLLVLNRMSRFLDWIELRPGALLADPVLALFSPIDLTWPAFCLIYGGLILGIFHLVKHPERLAVTMQAYALMVFLRGMAMYLLPLDAPQKIIVLRDPFVEFFGSGGQPLTRDLFFSGHTSTMFLLCLAAVTPGVKKLFFVGTLGIAACVLLQHVHYSIDVFAAPFFALGAFKIVSKLNSWLKPQ